MEVDFHHLDAIYTYRKNNNVLPQPRQDNQKHITL